MVQVQKHHLLPISLCFGYIPILILLPSVSYNRGKRYDGVSGTDSHLNGALFLYFFSLYSVCFAFIAFHILTIFYKNTWTAVLLNGVASLMNLCAGLALGSVLILYSNTRSRSSFFYNTVYRELKAIMAGVIFLMFTMIIGYSSWPGFAKVKLKFLRPTQQPGGNQTTKIVNLILIVSIIIGGIGLLCHTGGAIGYYTVALKDSLKDQQDNDIFIFWVVSLYMVVNLYVLLVSLLILTIALPYEKYPWISYLISPLNCLMQIFVGSSLLLGLIYVTVFSDDTLADLISIVRKIFRSMISVSVGSMLLALSTIVYACCWSLKFWLNATASASSAETTQHERDTAVEQHTVSLIRNEDNEMHWIGNDSSPYPNVVLTHDTRQCHDDDDDDDDDVVAV